MIEADAAVGPRERKPRSAKCRRHPAQISRRGRLALSGDVLPHRVAAMPLANGTARTQLLVDG
jgi:hypothetical protein